MRRSVTTKSTKGGKRVGFERGVASRREYFREYFAGVCVWGGDLFVKSTQEFKMFYLLIQNTEVKRDNIFGTTVLVILAFLFHY